MSSLDCTSPFSYCPFLCSPFQQDFLRYLTIHYFFIQFCYYTLIRLLPPPLPKLLSKLINDLHVAESNGQCSILIPLGISATFHRADNIQFLGNILHLEFMAVHWPPPLLLYPPLQGQCLVLGPLISPHSLETSWCYIPSLYWWLPEWYFHAGSLLWNLLSSIQPSTLFDCLKSISEFIFPKQNSWSLWHHQIWITHNVSHLSQKHPSIWDLLKPQNLRFYI